MLLGEDDGMKSAWAVNLHNAVTVSQARLGKRLTRLSSERMGQICAALRRLAGGNPVKAQYPQPSRTHWNALWLLTSIARIASTLAAIEKLFDERRSEALLGWCHVG